MTNTEHPEDIDWDDSDAEIEAEYEASQTVTYTCVVCGRNWTGDRRWADAAPVNVDPDGKARCEMHAAGW